MARVEGRVALPWFVYVVVGVLVSGYAKLVQVKNPGNTAMTLFFYIGIVLVLVGFGKLGIRKTVKKEEKEQRVEKASFARELSDQQRRWEREQQRSLYHPAQHNIIVCPRCGTKHYATSNFCHKCGARLK